MKRGVINIVACCAVYLSACKQPVLPKQTQVLIQPMGDYDKELADSIVSKVKAFYGVEVSLNQAIEMPMDFYTTVRSSRFRADSIIRYLSRVKPDSVDYVLGLTSYDISTTKRDKEGNIKEPVSVYRDWGIFGLGFRPGPTCVVSTFRMSANRKKAVDRAQKVALHELGHNFGLAHCPSKDCFMQDAAETIKTIDKVDFNLCDRCKGKL